MRTLIFIFLITLISCSSPIDMNKIEDRSDALTYFKGTNKLVSGTVIRKFEDGRVVEKDHSKEGKQLGKWFSYDYDGNDFNHGYSILLDPGVIAANKNLNLTNSTLSFNIEGDYKHAALELPANSLKPGKSDLLALRNSIYNRYKGEYEFNDVYIFYRKEQYRFDKSNYSQTTVYDTILNSDRIIINVR
jgi:hypothetical protein